MIYIEERVPNKIPGITSLFVNFEYNDKLIEIIKGCSPAIFNKKTKEWEIPVTRLAKFINQSAKVDSISLKLYKESAKEVDKNVALGPYKITPFNHQLEAINYGLTKKDSWLLLDVPGLGKTLSAIYLAQELKKRDNIEHCLIICGVNSLKINWELEINKVSDLSCKILGKKVTSKGRTTYGSVKDRLEELKQPIKEFFVITNIETLRSDEILKELQTGINKFDIIILDEAHNCKNPTATQTQHLLKLNKAKYKVALTGTLLLNSPFDCWVPLMWIGEEHSSFSVFKSQYGVYGGLFNNELVGYKNLDVLAEQIENCSLRRTKDKLNLPPLTNIDEIIDMDSDQETFYLNLVNGIVEEVDKVELTMSNLLSMVTRLRQATACPSILTTNSISSVKLNRASQHIEEILSTNEKVVVFSVFKEPLVVLQDIIKDSHPLLCTGDIKDSDIEQNVKLFLTDVNYPVLLATHSKMGTGWTLNSACYSIFIDTPWTAALCQQSADRIHRINSTKPCFIYKLYCNNSIDLRVKQIVDNKEALGDYLVDHKTDATTLNLLKNLILDLKAS